ncbi:hypothetical protein ACIGCZ_33715 [Streptomyces nigra]|uniref:hypothetical protein n=1 Tax=Streptomyces nigra TaxID=1827580 RepID=UPI0037D1DA6C
MATATRASGDSDGSVEVPAAAGDAAVVVLSVSVNFAVPAPAFSSAPARFRPPASGPAGPFPPSAPGSCPVSRDSASGPEPRLGAGSSGAEGAEGLDGEPVPPARVAAASAFASGVGCWGDMRYSSSVAELSDVAGARAVVG